MTRVQITRNFARNLDDIREFLHQADAGNVFDRLLDELFDQIIPVIEKYPDLGVDFYRHPFGTREAGLRIDQLRQRLGAETSLRELIRGDFLLLYAQRKQVVYLLAIKHHRQLSFDLAEFWPGQVP